MPRKTKRATVQHKTRPDRNSNSNSKTVLEANLVGGDEGKTPQLTNLESSRGKETVWAACHGSGVGREMVLVADPAVATK